MSKIRYTTEAVIIEWIDKYTEQMHDLLTEADAQDCKADKLRNTQDAHEIPKLRDDAEKKRKRADWRRRRLATLREMLAEFRTIPIEAVLKGDNSVQGI